MSQLISLITKFGKYTKPDDIDWCVNGLFRSVAEENLNKVCNLFESLPKTKLTGGIRPTNSLTDLEKQIVEDFKNRLTTKNNDKIIEFLRGRCLDYFEENNLVNFLF